METKRRWPELFADAVEIDARMRDGLAFAKEPYLHSLRMPLSEAVALDEAQLGMDWQRDGSATSARGTVECENTWWSLESNMLKDGTYLPKQYEGPLV